MNEQEVIRLLLIEDDEEDMILTRDLLREIRGRKFEIEWAQSYDGGLRALKRNQHDICLVDYRLGAHDGIELVKAARADNAETPFILLTGMGQEEVDVAAMNAGASDYLVKGNVDAQKVERTIRYAIERKRAASRAAFEQARLAAFGAQIGYLLTQRTALPTALENCAATMTQFLNAALAQLWIYDRTAGNFVLTAASGTGYNSPGNEAKTFPVEAPLRGEKVFISSLDNDPFFTLRFWAKQNGFVSLAAFPLVQGNELVGCITLYSSETMAETVLQELGSVANSFVLGIRLRQAESLLAKARGSKCSGCETDQCVDSAETSASFSGEAVKAA